MYFPLAGALPEKKRFQDELDSVLLGEKLMVLGNLEPFKLMCSLWGATPLALGFPGS